MKPRVLHVVAAGEIGGAERMLAGLVRQTGVEHAVVLFTPTHNLARLFTETGARVYDRGRVAEGPLHFLARSFLPGDLGFAQAAAKDFQANVIHAHTFGSQVLAARLAEKGSRPLVRTEHSTRVYVDPTCTPFSLWSLRRTSHAVAVSEYVRNRALNVAPWIASKMRVIRNGVDADHFSAVPFPSFGSTLRLAIVGRLEPRKGVDRALAIMAKLDDATLDVIGDGESARALRDLQKKLGLEGRVRFHGYQDDVRPIVANAHALLSTSREEGLGIALLEGMALGRPVLGLRVGGVAEIVEHGKTGFLTSDPEIDSLVHTIEEARRSVDLSILGKNAREFVAKQASLSAMMDGYRTVYEEAIVART